MVFEVRGQILEYFPPSWSGAHRYNGSSLSRLLKLMSNENHVR